MSDTRTEDQAVANFREYLRINTVQPRPDYAGAVKYLTKMAAELSLPYKTYEMVPGKPIFIMTWEGKDPSLSSLMLNSHTDVVPVYPECWKYDPFEAVKEENGDIYARGSQDMKCVGQQYIEAIRRLKADGKRFLRTIHLTFMPDEEINSVDGMVKFVRHDAFKQLNIGYCLDEGIACIDDTFNVYYGERIGMALQVTVQGSPGHGSQFLENTAGEKLRRIINSFLNFRDEEESRMKKGNLAIGDVTTTNLTGVSGGVQTNVVPAELSATFDIRVTPGMSREQLEEKILGWCAEAGEGVTFKFLNDIVGQTLTPITKDDKWWNAFITPLDDMGLKLNTQIFPAGTDGRFLRDKGYKAIGFSPMNHTPILLHDHNEYLNEGIYMRGIDIYTKLIPSLADVQ